MNWLQLPLLPPATHQVHLVIDHGIRAVAPPPSGPNWGTIEAVGVVIAAVTGSIALWYNAMPLCDVHRLNVLRNGDKLRIETEVKNVGNGYSPEVKIWLLEYGEVSDFTKPDHYIAPMGPHETLKFESADIIANGKVTGDKYRVLLRWKALLWTIGETYLEEHFGDDDETERQRIKLVYPWGRLWRSIRKYNGRERERFVSPLQWLWRKAKRGDAKRLRA